MAECRYGDLVEQCSLAQKFIYPIYNGLDQSALAGWIKASVWIVPWAGALHLLALGLLGGAVLIVDMRVLGGGLVSHSPAKINRVARPLTIVALALAILTGLTMAFSELMKLYFSPPYWVKMASLAAAITFTFGVRNRVIETDGRLSVSGWALAAASIALWAGVFVYLSDAFARAAMLLLLISLLAFAWVGVWREQARSTAGDHGWTKLASVISIAMWLTTATAGRWIAFY